MKKFFIQNQIELYTLAVLVIVLLGAADVYDVTPIRKLMLIIMVIGVFHEWEEKKWPGGFFEIMGPLWGWDLNKVDVRVAERWVVYAWFIVAGVPMIFDNITGFALTPLFLGIFETFGHSAGKIITGLDRKYFPGVVTAWIYGASSVWCIVAIGKEYGITSGDCIIGLVFLVVVYALLQALIQHSAGSSIPEMAAAMKNRKRK